LKLLALSSGDTQCQIDNSGKCSNYYGRGDPLC